MAMNSERRFRLDPDVLARLDPAKTTVSYDRDSDTLMVHFGGRGRPAVSVPSPKPLTRDFVFLRFDPASGELVGVQVEDFLNLFLPEHPETGILVERAELRGITEAELGALLRTLPDEPKAASSEAVIEELVLSAA
jgi:hypothetical protein